jgi:hypothetical protein
MLGPTPFPHRVHVLHPESYLSQLIDRLGLGGHRLGDAFDPEPANRCLGVEGVGRYPGVLPDAILHEPVDEVHVRPHQFHLPAQVLLHEPAVMYEELEIEVGDIGASSALAGVVHDHQLDRAPERHVGVLDQLHQCLPVLEGLLPPGVAEHRVALQLGDRQWRPGVVDHQPEQVAQRIAGVLQLGVVEEGV